MWNPQRQKILIRAVALAIAALFIGGALLGAFLF